ncbi:MAG TPA: hypothetical protein VGP46_13515 [Acidimicrobiales bacterium]|jgi:hypothetical protein|nr:hypothetical protein [Acidimicrobiales bacterium]
MSGLRRASAATAHFILDLLAADTPEVLATTGAVVALAFLVHDSTTAATVLLPVAVVAGLMTGVWRGRGRRPGA